MIFLIIFLLISFHFLFPGAVLNEPYHIRKVGGENIGLSFGKFRALLGLRSFMTRKESYHRAKFGYGAQAPCPSEVSAPAPAPARALPLHVHSHHHLSPRPHLLPRVTVPFQKMHADNEGKNSGRRKLVAILVSTSATFVLCGIGLTWGCKKIRKKRRSTRTVSVVHSTEGGTRSVSKYVVNSQNSVRKVTSDPGPDLFYLNTIESALEPQPFTIKAWDSVNADSLVSRETVSVNEADKRIKHEPIGCSSQFRVNDIPDEAHSSDDESFHSLSNSHSSNARLSNASAGTVSDTSEVMSNALASPVNFGMSSPAPALKSLSCPPPPPPPPLPPLASTHISPPSSSASCSTKRVSTSPSSSTLLNLLSPKNSYSSSGSNQNISKAPIGIPRPPVPPPPTKGYGNPQNGPPPPPLPQQIPLSKDGVPLAKLKPLHWDKVRASPDQSMVWDKLRSSSFE